MFGLCSGGITSFRIRRRATLGTSHNSSESKRARESLHGDSASQKNIRSKTSGLSSQVSRNAKIDHHEETIKESLAARWGTPTRGGWAPSQLNKYWKKARGTPRCAH